MSAPDATPKPVTIPAQNAAVRSVRLDVVDPAVQSANNAALPQARRDIKEAVSQIEPLGTAALKKIMVRGAVSVGGSGLLGIASGVAAFLALSNKGWWRGIGTVFTAIATMLGSGFLGYRFAVKPAFEDPVLKDWTLVKSAEQLINLPSDHSREVLLQNVVNLTVEELGALAKGLADRHSGKPDSYVNMETRRRLEMAQFAVDNLTRSS